MGIVHLRGGRGRRGRDGRRARGGSRADHARQPAERPLRIRGRLQHHPGLQATALGSPSRVRSPPPVDRPWSAATVPGPAIYGYRLSVLRRASGPSREHRPRRDPHRRRRNLRPPNCRSGCRARSCPVARSPPAHAHSLVVTSTGQLPRLAKTLAVRGESWGRRRTAVPSTRTRFRAGELAERQPTGDRGRGGYRTSASRSPRAVSSMRSAKTVRAAGQRYQRLHHHARIRRRPWSAYPARAARGDARDTRRASSSASRSPRPGKVSVRRQSIGGSSGRRSHRRHGALYVSKRGSFGGISFRTN